MIVGSKRLPEFASDTYVVEPPETLRIPEPFSLSEIPKELKDKVGEFELPYATVNVLNHVSMVGSVGSVLTTEGDVILDCGFSGRLDLFERQRAFYTAALRCLREDRPSFLGVTHSMIGIWALNYFHWHTEFLTALQGILPRRPKDLVFLVHPNAPQFALETLTALGLSYTKTTATHIKIRELWVPTTRRWKGRTSAKAIEWLRKEVGARVSGNDDVHKIYISRRKAEERRVINENELWSALKGRGYTRVYAEKLSFADQVRLFRGAHSVIAPHGAGLTNVIYAERQPTVLELFADYVNPCYYTIFSSLSFPYGFVRAEQEGKDMRVDVEAVLTSQEALDRRRGFDD